jgi:hypothetical protein
MVGPPQTIFLGAFQSPLSFRNTFHVFEFHCLSSQFEFVSTLNDEDNRPRLLVQHRFWGRDERMVGKHISGHIP